MGNQSGLPIIYHQVPFHILKHTYLFDSDEPFLRYILKDMQGRGFEKDRFHCYRLMNGPTVMRLLWWSADYTWCHSSLITYQHLFLPILQHVSSKARVETELDMPFSTKRDEDTSLL